MTRQKRCNRSQRGRWDDRFDRIMDRVVCNTNEALAFRAFSCGRNDPYGRFPHSAQLWKWNRARGRVIGGAS